MERCQYLSPQGLRGVIMAKQSELQKASQAGYKLFALTKAAQYGSEELETSEVSALFELACDLSECVVSFLQSLEEEEMKNAK